MKRIRQFVNHLIIHVKKGKDNMFRKLRLLLRLIKAVIEVLEDEVERRNHYENRFEDRNETHYFDN